MRKLKYTVAAVLLLMAAFACKSQYELLLASNDVDAKYQAAMELYNNQKFTKAAQLFESMAILTSGTARDDTVQFYWGMSNYRNKDFYTAESNFARFVQNFPRSPFTADAEFYRLDCMYRATYRWELDQMPTRSCMASISEYMREHPDDDAHLQACQSMMADLQDRLDRKDFEAGRQYYQMEDYPAARVKLRNVLKTNADNNYREDVLYYTAMASYHYARLSVWQKQRERYLVFVDDYLNFVGEYPESHYRKELDNLYRRVQKTLGRDGNAPDEAPVEK
ncbi:MAG: outer membrane protein assembly factor BamD [Bacteroidales bacterium]|jgi:outer membrane protein assembly factor BamD|nr:outer membrane protein assembly factor BamD [Bacteroidales bacterium]